MQSRTCKKPQELENREKYKDINGVKEIKDLVSNVSTSWWCTDPTIHYLACSLAHCRLQIEHRSKLCVQESHILSQQQHSTHI